MVIVRRGFTNPFLLLLAACGGADARSDEALALRAPVIGESVDADDVPLDSALVLARARYDDGDYELARELLGAVANRARESGESEIEAEALTWLSYAFRWLGNYDESESAGRRAVQIRLDFGLVEGIWRSHNALGLLDFWRARLTDAQRHFEDALSAAEVIGDAKAVAQVQNNLGLVYFDQGQLPAARARFEALVRVARDVEDSSEEALGLTNLGMADLALGDVLGAIESLERARRIWSDLDRPDRLQVALGFLSTAYLARGDPASALQAVDSALAISRRQGLRSDEAQNLELLAAIHTEVGDVPRALRMLDRARATQLELGDDLMAGRNLASEARLLLNHDLERAEQSALRALELHRGIEAHLDELYDRIVLAEIAARRADRPGAMRELAIAEGLARRLPTGRPALDVLLARARVADLLEEPRRALEALAALSPPEADLPFAIEWEAAALAARSHLRVGELEHAVERGREAVAAVNVLSGRLGPGQLVTSLVAARVRTHSDLILALLLTGRREEAFAVADAARGGPAMRQVTRSAESDGARPTVRARADSLLRRVKRLQDALDTLEAYPDETDARGLVEARQRLVDARRDFEELRSRSDASSPRALSGLGAGRIDPDVLRSALGEDEALIEYFVAPDHLMIFVATRTTLEVSVREIDQAQLAGSVRLARERLSRIDVDPPRVSPLLEELYRMVISPAVQAAPIATLERWIIVPHGPLAYLPFSALRDPDSGDYLIERHSLSFLPSAGVLAELDAVIDTAREDVRATILAPRPGSLPGTRAEAALVEAALPGSRLFLGPAATEAAGRAALESESIVHLAAHAALVPEAPLFSYVELSPPDDADATGDGRLEVHEVLGLAIESPLVFLSACETGVGNAWSHRFSEGEDVMALSRAFLLAGADAVVATLWRIEDEGAASFAADFYRALADGTSPSGSLAVAARAMLRGARYASPYYWASYRVAAR